MAGEQGTAAGVTIFHVRTEAADGEAPTVREQALVPGPPVVGDGDAGALRSGWPATVERRDAPHALGLQVWVDVDAGHDCGHDHDHAIPCFGGERLRAAVDTALDAIAQVASARLNGQDDELREALAAWSELALRPEPGRAPAGWDDPTAAPSTDADLFARIVAEGRGVVAGMIWRRREGAVKARQKLLVALGPDRYCLHIQFRDTARRMGDAVRPNVAQPLRIGQVLRNLEDACDALDNAIARLDGDVGAALATLTDARVAELLEERAELLRRCRELERRRRRFRRACRKLGTGRIAGAIVVDEQAVRDLDQLEPAIEAMRGQLVEIPQLLLAGGAWRQTQRTEALSLAAAALVPPALVAGVLGANVLPWEQPAGWEALVGMVLVMVASAAAGMAYVVDRIVAPDGGGRAARSRLRSRDLAALAAATGVAGVVLCVLGVA